ncbi:MAG: branched-chain amino acid ABC transporter permease [Pseudomonadota bacterium]
MPKFALLNQGRLVWGLFALLLLIAPLVFSQGRALSILSQMAIMMIFGLSFNMLLGQGGMLSFGHAVYSGLGAFCAVHAMNRGWLPVTLIPLLGGVAGMFFGIVFGYLTTKKSGTTFAMITLGLGELVFACSLMFPEFFGGEGGVSTNRTAGKPVLGISYGPQIEVYYLIAAWLFASAAAMFAFTQTPLGRIINAVRDNPERAEFIGYDSHWVRYLNLILSAFFAGIAGGLSAINFEMVSAENVGAVRSGAVLLFTFIGGIGYFFGPMIGAVVGVFLSLMLADWSKAWQLYLGAFFIVIVMFAPGGIAGLIMQHLRIVQHGFLHQIWRPWLAICTAGATALCGLVMLVEMLYRHSLDAADGSVMQLVGFSIDSAQPSAWLSAIALLLAGIGAVIYLKPALQEQWRSAHAAIDQIYSGAAR